MSQLDSWTLDAVFGCHLWTGKISSTNGRPIVWRGRRPSSAHVVAYEATVGPIADGLVLDHLCRRPMCIAPHHLEPVTKSENELRKMHRYRVRRTRCPRGHDMKLNAIVTPEGGRVCRSCNHTAGVAPAMAPPH